MKIRRLLIANRGEIALRIIRACRELGIDSVAVHSTIDGRSPHVMAADHAVEIGAAPAAESYLSIATLIDAARRIGADAVHPGYGFLAENPTFADACQQAGLIFIGPPAEVIAKMGSKIEARRLMESAGVDVVAGETPADQSDAGLRKAARRVGYPVLIKASAGGGGKGMRPVRRAEALDESIHAARREATAAFGDGTLYVERLLEQPRHIEFQIIADQHGGVVHLFERECSIQRRHQKIIEESPSPALTRPLRARMGAAAVSAARAAAYQNAGTVEFLVEGQGDEARFYFLEVNARLQVEHPVTEAVAGVDLVHAQLAVASGERLPWSQADLIQSGHALECRVYAEDPARDFLPEAGRLLLYREPAGAGIRVDSGVIEGSEVPVYYDPLLAKLVAYGATRDTAITRAADALRAYAILGIRTNIAFLLRAIEHPRFRQGQIDTSFIEIERTTLLDAAPDASLAAAVAAAAVHDAATVSPAQVPRAPSSRRSAASDPWTTLKNWRS